MSANILIVDDEQDIRGLIQGILEDEGYTTRLAANDKQAYDQINDCLPQLIVLDIWLQNSKDDGIEILTNIKSKHPEIPVLMISGHGTIETAVSALKIGAYDFIEKPFKSDRLLLMIERALETAQLRSENVALKKQAEAPYELVGSSSTMNTLRQSLDRVAQTNSRVLITGEAGTGKDLAARYIQKMSSRAHEPFLTLNCATMRPERLEIELFGTEKDLKEEPGYIGVLEKARGGTLFLDEVADMPLETQGKIVRVLQEQCFQRVGGQEQIEVDVRILASTNRNLEKEMQDGNFRQDLYYRLNVVPIEMPALKGHPQDIPELTSFFVTLYSEQSGLAPCKFSQSCLAAMQVYDWPGNVRQLKNAIERVMIMTAGSEKNVQTSDLPQEIISKSGINTDNESSENIMALSLRDAREAFEKEYLSSQIKRFGGNISKTSEFVGMERSALHRKLKQLGISTISRQNDNEPSESDSDKIQQRA